MPPRRPKIGGAASDPLEHEADRAAEQVMRMPEQQGISLEGRPDEFRPPTMQAIVFRKAEPAAANAEPAAAVTDRLSDSEIIGSLKRRMRRSLRLTQAAERAFEELMREAKEAAALRKRTKA